MGRLLDIPVALLNATVIAWGNSMSGEVSCGEEGVLLLSLFWTDYWRNRAARVTQAEHLLYCHLQLWLHDVGFEPLNDARGVVA